MEGRDEKLFYGLLTAKTNFVANSDSDFISCLDTKVRRNLNLILGNTNANHLAKVQGFQDMNSWLSRCCTARGSSVLVLRGGPSKVESFKFYFIHYCYHVL